MVTQSLPHEAGAAPGGRLRPINPARDLGAIARLIEVAFADELSPGGHAVMRELQTLNVLGPFIWLLARISPAFDELLSGFVWEEHGTIVGNTTLTRAEGALNHWIISNVAVMPSHRRRGIAHALMAAAIEHARARHAHRILLQVRADNESARRLYFDLGFQVVEAVTELRAASLPPDLPPPSGTGPEVIVRRATLSHRHQAYEVARAAIPAGVQRVRPLRPYHFQIEEPGLLSPLVAWLTGHWREQWLAEVSGQVRGLLTVERHRGLSPDRAEWYIHPEARGQVEAALVRLALARLHGRRQVRANVPTYEEPLLALLRRSGFQEVRTLEQMVLDIR